MNLNKESFQRIMIELTTACNLDCVYCFQDRTPAYKLDRDLLIDLIDFAQESNIGEIVLTGGEPTMHPDFVEVYEYARKLGFIVKVYSNAIKYPQRVWDSFSKLPPHEVEVSVYGRSQSVFETFTQKRMPFDSVDRTVDELLAIDVPVFLKYNVTTVTVGDLGEFINYAKNKHIPFSVNVQVIPKTSGDLSPLDYRLSPDEVKEIEKRHGLDFLKKNMEAVDRRGCDLGKELYITSEGKVQGCPIYVAVSKDVREIDIRAQAENLLGAYEYVRNNRKFNQGVCPAWLHLEGADRVGEFLRGIGADDLRRVGVENE